MPFLTSESECLLLICILIQRRSERLRSYNVELKKMIREKIKKMVWKQGPAQNLWGLPLVQFLGSSTCKTHKYIQNVQLSNVTSGDIQSNR